MANAGKETANRISDAAGDLQKTASNVTSRVESAASEQFDRLESAIRRNPMAATGIAAGVGFILAALAKR
ncbi:MAG: hypothetical protein AB7O43_18505 [Hyphomicrobiaceae bacterium]